MTKLTLKQKLFVIIYLKRMNATEAAMEVYEAKSRAVAAQIGYENLRKPDVIQAIAEALAEGGLTMSVCIENLAYLINSRPTKISGEVKLKACIEALKLMGQYPN